MFKKYGVAPESEPERSRWIDMVARSMYRRRYKVEPPDDDGSAFKCQDCNDSGWTFYKTSKGYEYADRCSCRVEDINKSPGRAMGFPQLSKAPKKSDIEPALWDELNKVGQGDSIFLYGSADKTLQAGYVVANTVRLALDVMPRYHSVHRFPSKSMPDAYRKWKQEVLEAECVVVDGLCRGCETQSLQRVADLIEEAGRAYPRKTLIILGEALDPDAYPANVWSRISRGLERIVKVRWRIK